MKKLVASLSLAAMLVVGSAGVALAQDGGAGSGSNPDAPAAQPRVRHRAVKHAAKVAADAIGISTTELRDALKSGKSIAQVAQEHGVDPATVVDAIVQARTAKVQERAQKLVDHQFGGGAE
jgi:hypothetical protein